jgi:hypothetical protein
LMSKMHPRFQQLFHTYSGQTNSSFWFKPPPV